MPSLVVIKSENDHNVDTNEFDVGTYQHFYNDAIGKTSVTDVDRHSSVYVIAIVWYIVCILLINLIIFGVNYLVWVLRWGTLSADLTFPTFILSQFILTILIISIFFNEYANNSVNAILIISFVINVLIGGSILTLLICLIVETDYYLPGHLKHYFCALTAFKGDYCDVNFSLFQVFLYGVYSPLSLLICIVINHFMFKCSYKCKTTKNNGQTEAILPLSHDNEVCNDNNVNTNNKSKYRIVFVIFWLIWMIFSIIFHLLTSINPQTVNLDYYFYFLLSMTAIFKLILKKLARFIDIIRKNNYHLHLSNNKYAFVYFISFEILVEIVISILYFNVFYYFFIFELSIVKEYTQFVNITVLHVCSEIIQSLIRFSRSYFDVTSKLLNLMIGCNDNLKMLNIIIALFKDDSSFFEWQTRHSIDMSMRVISTMIGFTNVLLYVFAIGYKIYGFKDKAQFHRGIIYFFISFTIDMVYFLLLFLFNYYNCKNYTCCNFSGCNCKENGTKKTQGFNVWKPFLNLFELNYKIMFVTFLIASLLYQFSGFV